MLSRLSSLLVWGLVAAAAVFWGLRLFVHPAAAPAQVQLASSGPLLAADLSRLFGAAAPAPAEPAAIAPDVAARFRLTGVVATRSRREASDPSAPGLALIAVDGKPPQAYRVGDALDASLVLQSVGLRSARIGTASAGTPGGIVLELPPPAPPATGVPSDFGAAALPPPVMQPPAMPPGTMPPGTVPPPAFTSPGAPAAPPGLLPGAAPPNFPAGNGPQQDGRMRQQSQ